MEKVEAKRLSSCEVRIVMLEYRISVSAILEVPLYGKKSKRKYTVILYAADRYLIKDNFVIKYAEKGM